MDYSLAGRAGVAAARPRARSAALRLAVPLFTCAIFTGSSLLFLVQPLFAKMLLPRLGGSSSVWNTCVLFFQATLLLGYVYAHVTTRLLGVRRQAIAHLAVLLLPLAVLPLSAGEAAPPPEASPVLWLLATMALTIGLPFFVVATTAPLLQRWFSAIPLASARDPYFLYSASNLGSMLALLGYPFLLEPALGVRAQTAIWTVGYVLLICLTGACAWMLRGATVTPDPRHAPGARQDEDGHGGHEYSEDHRHHGHHEDHGGHHQDHRDHEDHEAIDVHEVAREFSQPARRRSTSERVTPAQRAWWVALSFVPSSLMLGVTTHVSSDIAAVPLMWVVPLALYLLTFVLAFARREIVPRNLLVRAVPPLVLASLLTIFVGVQLGVFIPLHLATFFCAALLCHLQLADRRPGVAHLTEFYIWMSLGGMLGGICNTLIAPQVFATILEYPFVLAAAALLRPAVVSSKKPEPLAVVVAVAAIVLACGSILILNAPSDEVAGLLLATMVGLSIPIAFARRAHAFGMVALALVAVIALGRPASAGTVLFVGRSFFGMHKVIESVDGTYRTLQHGSTVHGRQQLGAASACEPTSYYVPQSPIGQLFASRAGRVDRVGIIGLGSGGLACYAETGERWTFYEIDPLVDRIAKNPAWFTQLRNSRGSVDVVLGDGRITVQQAPPGEYDVFILDAFSSDAIPLHLLTREALQLYLSRLAPDGVIALHISNRYFDLEPMLGALVHVQGVQARTRIDDRIPPEDLARGRLGSHWVMIARTPEVLDALDPAAGWGEPRTDPRVRPWTDDYTNILSVLTYSRR